MENSTKILIVLLLGSIMAAIDGSIVLLAFPTISQDLNANLSSSIWTLLIYMIVSATLTVQLGRVGDIYGRAKMFNLGFVVFTIASATAGFAPDILSLIISRGVQAIGSALMLSNSGAIVADVFPKEKLGRAFGYIASGWSVGGILGIALGGIITTLLGWRYIFYINLPIGAVALYLGLRYLKDVNIKKRRLDIVGMLLLAASLCLVSFGVLDLIVNTTGISTYLVLAGLVFGILFLVYEHKHPDPLIDLKHFRNRVLRYSMLAAFFMSVGYMGVTFLVILYLQGVRGLSPLNAALLFLPGYLISGVLAPKMGRLSDIYGVRKIATVGILCFGAATLVYITLNASTDVYIVMIASVFTGLGVSMFFPANNKAVMSNAPQDSYGVINGILRNISGIGVLFSYVIAIFIAFASLPPAMAEQLFVGTTTVIGGISDVFIHGIHIALAVAFFFIIIAGIFSLVRGK